MLHARVEQAITATPLALGLVERVIGLAQQRVFIFLAAGQHRDADTGLHADAVAIEVIRLAQRGDQPGGEGLGICRLGAGALQDGELVTAEPGDEAAVEAVLIDAQEAAGMPVDEAGPQRVYPTIVANIAPAARAALAEAGSETRHEAMCGDADAKAAIIDSASVINAKIRAAELRLLLAGPDDRVPILPAFYDVRTGRVRWL